METIEKLNTAVKISQSYIMLLLKDYLDESEIQNIANLFQNCPVEISEIANKQNEFGYSQAIGGIAQKDKISILIKLYQSISKYHFFVFLCFIGFYSFSSVVF